MSVFKRKEKSHLESKMFFDGSVDIARYDQVKYPSLDKLTDKMLGFFWRPEEIDIGKDKTDFGRLMPHEQHIFTSNLKRQILLDSVQGRAPSEAFLPHASLPELEPLIQTWTFMETIHSRSYTHIIRNIYADPSKVFDTLQDVPQIMECAADISKYYDDLIESPSKKNLWLALNSVNVLEGIRFYVSFACSWAFAELKKMEGNAKIIKFIARDENVHLAITQTILKALPKDDPDFAKIKEETEGQVIQMFMDAIDQEKKWADYLFSDGSMIGLNARLLHDYIEWIGSRRMKTLGYTAPFHTSQANPLPWTERWIGGGNVQVAPQETEISSYVIGGVKQDVNEETFKGLTL